MVLDGLRGYIQLASGLTEVTRARAQVAARALLAQGEAGVGAVLPPPIRAQVGALTEDLLATSRANREQLVHLVRTEVERSVSRLGLVASQELEAATRLARSLERRVVELEQELRRARTGPAAKKTSAKKTSAKKTSAKKASAKKTSAKKTSAKKTSAKKAT